ncbi:MAG: aminoglycoside 6-N-acetyltransferase [Actinomycetota bacterium]|nr:aminoglycoside 6-N-acetyltransferase [Actinomycetota bacterium]
MAWSVLTGERMTLRPPVEADVASLARILAEDEVSRWWVGYDDSRVRDEIVASGSALVMEIDGRAAGAIFLYPNEDAEYRHTVIHLFLGADWYRQRYGAEALTIAIEHLASLGHHRFTLDPNVNNGPAIRSYERLGFKRVGVLRQYQLRPEGHWEDGLLMDLVLSDFPDGLDWRRD